MCIFSVGHFNKNFDDVSREKVWLKSTKNIQILLEFHIQIILDQNFQCSLATLRLIIRLKYLAHVFPDTKIYEQTHCQRFSSLMYHLNEGPYNWFQKHHHRKEHEKLGKWSKFGLSTWRFKIWPFCVYCVRALEVSWLKKCPY